MARRALVTGGSRGIGAAIVRQLVGAGFDVEFTFRKSQAAATVLEDETRGKCRGHAVDSSDHSAIRAFMAEQDRTGPFAVLVNNAGTAASDLITSVSVEHMNEFLSENLSSLHLYCSLVIPSMRRARGGDIINISSLAATNVRAGNGLYGLTKAAIERYSMALAFENARFGVCVNVIAPGYVETELTGPLFDKQSKGTMLVQIPAKRFTLPEEVAQAVTMVAMRKPSLYGARIPVGGGGQI